MKILKTIATFALAAAVVVPANAQKKGKKEAEKPEGYVFTTVKENPITSIKNQSRSSTCWSFSAISFLESEAIRKGTADKNIDLSEMFIVSNAYADKAEKFVRLDGNLNFGPGSDFGDVIDVWKTYGIVPESEMKGLNYGTNIHTHGEFGIRYAQQLE